MMKDVNGNYFTVVKKTRTFIALKLPNDFPIYPEKMGVFYNSVHDDSLEKTFSLNGDFLLFTEDKTQFKRVTKEELQKVYVLEDGCEISDGYLKKNTINVFELPTSFGLYRDRVYYSTNKNAHYKPTGTIIKPFKVKQLADDTYSRGVIPFRNEYGSILFAVQNDGEYTANDFLFTFDNRYIPKEIRRIAEYEKEKGTSAFVEKEKVNIHRIWKALEIQSVDIIDKELLSDYLVRLFNDLYANSILRQYEMLKINDKLQKIIDCKKGHNSEARVTISYKKYDIYIYVKPTVKTFTYEFYYNDKKLISVNGYDLPRFLIEYFGLADKSTLNYYNVLGWNASNHRIIEKYVSGSDKIYNEIINSCITNGISETLEKSKDILSCVEALMLYDIISNSSIDVPITVFRGEEKNKEDKRTFLSTSMLYPCALHFMKEKRGVLQKIELYEGVKALPMFVTGIKHFDEAEILLQADYKVKKLEDKDKYVLRKESSLVVQPNSNIAYNIISFLENDSELNTFYYVENVQRDKNKIKISLNGYIEDRINELNLDIFVNTEKKKIKIGSRLNKEDSMVIKLNKEVLKELLLDRVKRFDGDVIQFHEPYLRNYMYILKSMLNNIGVRIVGMDLATVYDTTVPSLNLTKELSLFFFERGYKYGIIYKGEYNEYDLWGTPSLTGIENIMINLTQEYILDYSLMLEKMKDYIDFWKEKHTELKILPDNRYVWIDRVQRKQLWFYTQPGGLKVVDKKTRQTEFLTATDGIAENIAKLYDTFRF